MKTTLVVSDSVTARLKVRAAQSDRTIAELVEAALRRLLEEPEHEDVDLPELPTWDSSGALVDIADRDALYQAMEGR